MAKLPTRDDLGPMPSARSGRPIAKYDVTAVGKGYADMGNQLQRAGEKLSLAFEARQEKDDAFEADKRLIEWTREEQRALDEQRREMPAGGEGFAQSWNQGYEARARTRFDQARRDGLSPGALARIDLGLGRGHEGTFTRAHTFELEERRRFHREEVQTTLGGLTRDAAADPDQIDTYRTAGLSQIDNSRLDAADKYAERRAFLRKLEDEVRTAIVNGVDSGPAAAAARRRIVGDDQPARPQTRDRSGSDFMGGRAPGGAPPQGGQAPPIVPPSERGIREERALGGPLDGPVDPEALAYGGAAPGAAESGAAESGALGKGPGASAREPIEGLLTPGNIDLSNRPAVRNADGSISTVRTITLGMRIDGRDVHVALPTVGDDGRILTRNQAVEEFKRTKKHLGIFETEEQANAYAERLHQDQERQYGDREESGAVGKGPGRRSGPVEIRPLPGDREGRSAGEMRGRRPEGIAFHHTAGSSLESAINTNHTRGTGYNVLVDRDGTAYMVAPEDRYAAHMQAHGARDPLGNPARNGQFPHLNPDNTLSISAVAQNDRDVTPEQRATMVSIAQGWATKYGIKAENFIGHGDVQHGVRGRAGRERDEGSLALDFREGRIPLNAGDSPAGDRPGAPRVAQAPAATTNDAGPARAPTAGPVVQTGEGARLPGRPGSAQWANAALDAEDRGERQNRGILTNTTGPQRRATLRAIDARERQLVAPLTAQISRWEQGASNGILPPDAEIAQVQEQVEGFDDPNLTAHFRSVIDLAGMTREFRGLPPAQMDRTIEILERHQMVNGASDVAQRRLKHMQTLRDAARTAIDRDPNGWANTVGGVDFSASRFDASPNSFADDAVMQEHARMARDVGEYLGQRGAPRPPRFFSPEQRQSAQGIMRQGGAPMLNMLGSIVRNWGSDARAAIMEFAPDHPEMAFIGDMYLNSLGGGGPGRRAVEDAAQGLRLRADKNFVAQERQLRPTESEERAAAEILGSAYQAAPSTRSAAIATANLIYTVRAQQRGVTSFNQDLWRQGLREAIGEHTVGNVPYGGVYHQKRSLSNSPAGDPILMPPNLRQDAMLRILDRLRSEDLTDAFGEAPMTANGTPLSMAAIRDGRLVSIGPGRYWIAQGDPVNGQALWAMRSRDDGSGDPRNRYVLDLNALEPTLRKKTPEIYHGHVEPPITRQQRVVDVFTPGPREPDLLDDLPDARLLSRGLRREFRRQFVQSHPDPVRRRAVERDREAYARELNRFMGSLPRGAIPEEQPASNAVEE